MQKQESGLLSCFLHARGVQAGPKPPEAAGGHRRRRQAGFTVIIDDSTKQVQ